MNQFVRSIILCVKLSRMVMDIPSIYMCIFYFILFFVSLIFNNLWFSHQPNFSMWQTPTCNMLEIFLWDIVVLNVFFKFPCVSQIVPNSTTLYPMVCGIGLCLGAKKEKNYYWSMRLLKQVPLNFFKSFFRELSMLHAKCNVSKHLQEHACQKGHAKECAFGVIIF